MFIRDVDPFDRDALAAQIAELEAMPEPSDLLADQIAGLRGHLAALDDPSEAISEARNAGILASN